MRRVLAAVFLVALVVAWWFARGPAPGERVRDVQVGASEPRREVAAQAGPSLEARARRVSDGAVAREAMRERILAAAAARARGAAPGSSAPEPVAAPAAPKRPAKPVAQDEDVAPASPLMDRTGNHAYLGRVLGEQLMPLVDECHQLAREQHPGLTGMLMLDVEIVGDEDIGGVVDSLEVSAGNEVKEPAMIECVRESLLSITLPPPDHGGRDALMLSLRLEPDE